MKTKQKTNTRKIKLLEKTIKDEKLDSREFLRMQAVLLRLKGYSRQQVSDISGKSKTAIDTWVRLFNKQGLNALRTKKQQKPRTFILTREQKNEIKKLITKKSPNQLGLEESFWTTNALKKLVYNKFKVKYKAQKSYQRLFKYCGLTCQKVQERDSRKNTQDQEHFKTRLRKKLKKGVLTISW